MRFGMADEYILRVKGISKHFPGVQALNNVDFDLRPGEVHILLGENGAGKSTLVKILTGVYKNDKGSIQINGHEVEFQGPTDAMLLGISVIHQELSLAPHLDVACNIYLGRLPLIKGRLSQYLGWIDWETLYKQTAIILRDLDIQVDPHDLAGTLPASKAQMIEIARALSMDSRIIFMDEPTSSLSLVEQEELFDKINQLKARGIAIVYISHRLEEVLKIGDRITVLRDGKKIDTVKASEATFDSMVNMIVGHNTTERYPKKQVQKGEVVLKVNNLSRKGVLSNINFEVRKGEILGFAGLVGAGRTELARAIFGADPIEKGEIWISDKIAKIHSPRDAMHNGVAFLTEDRKKEGLLLNMSVTNNVMMAAINCDRVEKEYIVGWPRFGFLSFKTIRQRTKQYVDTLALRTSTMETEVRNLSGGNQQKAIIAKWLMTRANIFIFDEPTRGIDVGTKPEVYRLMEDLAEQGAAIIMISSEMPEVIAISDRILVICQGEITAELSRDKFNEELIMRYAATKGTAKGNIAVPV
jgi:ribose transport system ATP-binding protein